MIVTQSASAVQGSLGDLWYIMLLYVPAIIAALIVFIIGWVIGVILYRLIVEIARILRIDEVMRASGVADAVKEAGFKLNTGVFLGTLVMWFVMLGFLAASLQILGLSTVTVFIEQIVLLYLPHVIVAVLILILAAFVAEMVKKIVLGSARAAGSRHGNFAGSIAKWAIWIFAIMTVLTQLGIGAEFIQTLFTGFVIAVSIALGLAFGLGGKDAASRMIEHVRSEVAHDQD